MLISQQRQQQVFIWPKPSVIEFELGRSDVWGEGGMSAGVGAMLRLGGRNSRVLVGWEPVE